MQGIECGGAAQDEAPKFAHPTQLQREGTRALQVDLTQADTTSIADEIALRTVVSVWQASCRKAFVAEAKLCPAGSPAAPAC